MSDNMPRIEEINKTIYFDPYATHLPTLCNILNLNNIKSVFEFGCGNNSTLLFADKCEEVIAIEMQNESWYQEMKSKVGNNVKLLCQIGPTQAIETLETYDRKFDLIFVDGHGDSRWKAINVASKYTDIIVAHDTETPSYRWDLVNLDNRWSVMTDTTYSVYTTVWRKMKND